MRHEQGEKGRGWHRWLRRKSTNFAFLLPLILVNLLVSGFEDYHQILKRGTRWVALITLILTMYASGVGRKGLLLVASLALVVVLAWKPGLAYQGGMDIVVIASFNALVALAPIAILRKLWKEFAEEGVDAEVVLGALCAYLYIGSWFALIYGSLARLSEKPFFAQPGTDNPLNLMYFSFITLTSTGYGDLTPAYGPGRMFAATEAIIGQLYLVTVVALVVSAYRKRR